MVINIEREQRGYFVPCYLFPIVTTEKCQHKPKEAENGKLLANLSIKVNLILAEFLGLGDRGHCSGDIVCGF